ncbi:MAG: Crp/Fnr family transcriptional regulator [Actinomycetales bacterium]|nr:Crp/Fnr family transcriptional regulator [Actinomycetales bacterium]
MTPPLCVSRVPIFAGLSPAEQDEVHELARPRRVADGERVYTEGGPTASLLVVNTGRLRLTRSNRAGAEQLLRVLSPGGFVGVESFLTGAHPGHSATAMGDAVLCEFRHDDLGGLLDRYPEVGAAMLAALAEQLSRTEERLVAQTLEPVERRVAVYLVELPSRPDPRGLRIELPLAKKDIASYLGTSPESLSRSLRALAEAGIIAIEGSREILVLDPFALDELTA